MTAEAKRIREVEQNNRELKRANEILKPAASLFGAEVDPNTRRSCYYRRLALQPQRLMRNPRASVPRDSPLAAAAPAAGIWLSNPTLDHRPIQVQTLADGHETKSPSKHQNTPRPEGAKAA